MTRDFERELKEAFTRHETDVRPREDAWSGIEKGVKRAHARRLAVVSTGLVVLLAGVGLTVPRIIGSGVQKPPGNFATSPTGSPAPVAVDTSDWRARVAVQLGFTIKHPKDWGGGWFEGQWDFHPESLPSLIEGGDTFSVQVHALKAAQGPWADQTRELSSARSVTINGHAFERRETTDAGPKIVFYAGNWTYPSDEYLLVQLYGSTDALWERYAKVGDAIAQTVTPYDGSTPVHGEIEAGVEVDEHTKTLVRFLDARVEGIGADDVMSAQASEQYSDERIGLYGTGRPPTYYKRWVIQAREGVDANSVQFTVDVVVTEDSPVDASGEGHAGSGQIETIGVGPGKNVGGQNLASVVRFGEVKETYDG